MKINKSDVVRPVTTEPVVASVAGTPEPKMGADKLIRTRTPAASVPSAGPEGGLRKGWKALVSFFDRPGAAARRPLGLLLVGSAALTGVAAVTALFTLPLTASALLVGGAVFGGVAAFTALGGLGAYYLSSSPPAR